MKTILAGVILVSIFLSQSVHAQGPEDPGILPDSPLYLLKILGEKIEGFFIFSESSKAKYELQRAERRLNEAEALAGKGKHGLAIKVIGHYGDLIRDTGERLQELASREGESMNVQQMITEVQTKHIDTLGKVTKLVPEPSQAEIKQVIVQLQNFMPKGITGPSITVVSQNGGEIWEPGKTYTVSWESKNIPANAWVGKIELYKGDQFLVGIVPFGQWVPTGSVQYSVPKNSVTGDDFRIRAVLYQGFPGDESEIASDFSDAPFNISGQMVPTPPKGEAVWKMGYLLLTQNFGVPEQIGILMKVKETFAQSSFESTNRSAKIDVSDPVYIMEVMPAMLRLDQGGNVKNLDLFAVLKEFYKTHPDRYEFVSIYTTFPLDQPAQHETVIQSVLGIGEPVFDTSKLYGSNSILKGINVIGFIDQFKNTATLETQIRMFVEEELHELGHQWCCHVGDPFKRGVESARLEIIDQHAHFYPGLQSPSREPLGAQEWLPNGDGTFRVKQYDQNNPPPLKYHPFQLYFMGLLLKSEYKTEYPVYDAGLTPRFPDDFQRAMLYKKVSVMDIISVEGERKEIEPSSIKITVTSPNGGEKWETSKTYLISWQSTNAPQNAWVGKADFYKGDQFLFSMIPLGSQLPASSLVEYAVPPTSVTGDDFKIRVFLYQGQPGSESELASDLSDAPFSIVK